ncbi:MAG: biopolymer transporter ExbD [Candidatus Competibacteraceae bacterium]|nr:biopolymer transporter ExbD [Candidatus Competibacteraceae bacterium]
MRLEPGPPRRRRSFLTPMVDVVFLLLLYFMLVANVQDLRAIPLNAPAATGGAPTEDLLVIRLLADDVLELNGAPVGLDELTLRLRDVLSRDPDLTVWVRPASAVPLQQLVRVMDRVRATGVHHLNLVSE